MNELEYGFKVLWISFIIGFLFNTPEIAITGFVFSCVPLIKHYSTII